MEPLQHVPRLKRLERSCWLSMKAEGARVR